MSVNTILFVEAEFSFENTAHITLLYLVRIIIGSENKIDCKYPEKHFLTRGFKKIKLEGLWSDN